MKKDVIINDFTKEDFGDLFYEITIKMGILPGEKIPAEIVEFRRLLLQELFLQEGGA